VSNHGRTPAVIENVRIGITTSDTGIPLDTPIRADESNELFSASVIAAQSIFNLDERVPNGINFRFNAGKPIPKVPTNHDLFFWIIIAYHGPFTKGHQTSACWRWDGALCGSKCGKRTDETGRPDRSNYRLPGKL
jgi:hypothetical protein